MNVREMIEGLKKCPNWDWEVVVFRYGSGERVEVPVEHVSAGTLRDNKVVLT